MRRQNEERNEQIVSTVPVCARQFKLYFAWEIGWEQGNETEPILKGVGCFVVYAYDPLYAAHLRSGQRDDRNLNRHRDREHRCAYSLCKDCSLKFRCWRKPTVLKRLVRFLHLCLVDAINL